MQISKLDAVLVSILRRRGPRLTSGQIKYELAARGYWVAGRNVVERLRTLARREQVAREPWRGTGRKVRYVYSDAGGVA